MTNSLLFISLLLVSAAMAALAGGAPDHPLAPVNLRCEYLVNPPAVDVTAPRLSWEVQDARRGAAQSAYQVLVASSEAALRAGRGDLWDSGRAASDRTCQVAYGGAPLASGQRAWWKVRTWDATGRPSPWSKPATWRAGLLHPADWQAQWIADPTPAPPVRRAHNGYHSALVETPEPTGGDPPKWVALDLGETRRLDAVRLFPTRPFDWHADTPGFLFPLRFRVEVADTADFAASRTVVDRTQEDVPNPGAEPLTCRFAPTAARWVRLTVTRLGARDDKVRAFALAEMQALSGDNNLSLHAPVTAGDSIETGAWAAQNLTDGDTTSHPADGAEALPAPRFRREFTPGKPVRHATLYVTALGLYEMRLNGQRVGDHMLAPEWTDYHQRVQYQAFDVTKHVQPGPNALAAQMGDGWYAGRIGMSDMLIGVRRGVYGRKPRLRAQLELEYADGSREWVVTDDAWKSTMDGPLRSSDLYDGESYDARRETPGWDKPGFAAGGWKAVETGGGPSGARLVAQPNEPIRILHELKPVALTEPKPGVYIYDLGQNMVGWARMMLRGPAGTAVTFRHGEWLNDDGTLYTANLRGAPQTDHYTLRGGRPETWEPHFTYHGFRYVEVTGLPQKPRIGDLTGRVFNSSSPETGDFACSEALLNRLWRNILWTQRANLMSSPTDCPQRDERLGWMGDIQAFAQTAIFNMDMAGFFTKWVPDIRDAQADDGRFPDFAPHPYGRNERFTGAPAWGDAGTVVPWRAYVNYADTRMLAEHFEAARRWVDFIHRHNPDLLWNQARGNDYNDWLNGDTLVQQDWPKQGGAIPNNLLATAFFAHSTQLTAKMAAVLGREAEAQQYSALFEQIKAAFNRAFVGPDGRITGDTQAGYALALAFDLLPEAARPLAVQHMLAGIARYQGHISTGIQTTHRMMLELTRAGRSDVAYRLLLNRTFPSWLYSVDNGATTIWERWDGYVKGRGFQDPGMNSFNHWALGAVGEWMYRVILGLNPDESAPGWKRFILRPIPGGGLTWARGVYRSIQGPISVHWSLENGVFTLNTTLPANTTATVYIPAERADAVTEGGAPADRAPGVRFLRMEDGAAVFEVGAGTYHFTGRPPAGR